ncbi:MAG: hypothetical protein CM15mP120_16100 [Pseudomonadota bacterium]|nr:MAG: hypothetical protein CM15mP120_16100 [Pseudomonadota bacterium]
MAAPLDDVVVLEIDNWMAAPSAAAVLADMGATVIKIEPLTGDPMRDMSRPVKNPELAEGYKAMTFNSMSTTAASSLLPWPWINLRVPRLVRKLVAKADIFMCNLLTARQQSSALTLIPCLTSTRNWYTPPLLATAPPGLTLGDQVMTLLLFWPLWFV